MQLIIPHLVYISLWNERDSGKAAPGLVWKRSTLTFCDVPRTPQRAREGRSRLGISGVSDCTSGISQQKETLATPGDPETDCWALKVHKNKRFVRKEDRFPLEKNNSQDVKSYKRSVLIYSCSGVLMCNLEPIY